MRIVLLTVVALVVAVGLVRSAGAFQTKVAGGSISPANGTVFSPGTKTVPYAWKLDLPADCNTDLPWRNGILGTGFFIGPPGSPFADGKPHQGAFGRDAADDSKLEASGNALLLAPGRYTIYAAGSCVSKSNSAQRIEFETPRTTFMIKSKLSTLKIRSTSISELTAKGIDLFLTCGSNCVGATFTATLAPRGGSLGVATATPPGAKAAPFLPLPTMPPLKVKLTAAAKAKVAKLKAVKLQVKAIVRLADGETQTVMASATIARL